jgi:hypothetical protein
VPIHFSISASVFFFTDSQAAASQKPALSRSCVTQLLRTCPGAPAVALIVEAEKRSSCHGNDSLTFSGRKQF